MRFTLAVLLLLSLASCASTAPREHVPNANEKPPVQRYIVRKPPPGSLSDSLYDALSAMPVDSLTMRQYDTLQRERQRRATSANVNHVVGIWVTVVVTCVLVAAGLAASSGN